MSSPIPLDLTLRLLDDQATLAQLAKDRGWSDGQLVAHLQAAAAGQGQMISLEQAQATVLYQQVRRRRKGQRAWVHSDDAEAWRQRLAQIREAGRGHLDLVPWKEEAPTPTLNAQAAQQLVADLVAQGVVGPPPTPAPVPTVAWHFRGERPPDAEAWRAQMALWQRQLDEQQARLAPPPGWNATLFHRIVKITAVGWLAVMVLTALGPPTWMNPLALFAEALPGLVAGSLWGWARHRHRKAASDLKELQACHDRYVPHEVTLGDEALWRTHAATADTWAQIQDSEVPVLARDAQVLNQAVADHEYQAFEKRFEAQQGVRRGIDAP